MILARQAGALLLPAGLAAGILALAMQGGGYGLSVRGPVAILIWWTVGLGIMAGSLSLRNLPRPAWVAAAALAGLAVLAGISAAWAPAAEDALTEMARTTLYLGAFALVALTTRAGTASRWADGLAAGIAGVGIVALGSRLLPGLGAESSASSAFAGGFTFLSYPLEYWNALAVLIGLGIPLLLRAAVSGATGISRGIAISPLPALLAALYLTSSRGGMLAALVGTGTFLACAPRRWAIAGATAVGVAGGAGAVAVLAAREEIANGPFGTAEVAAQGRTAAVLISLLCLAAGFVWATLSGSTRLQAPRLPLRLRRVALLACGAAVLAVVVAANPAARLASFSEPPVNRVDAAQDPGTYTTTASHLLSTGGNGRWQFWTAAVEQFRSAPVIGQGAGSYETWWTQNGTISYFTRQAHSLYLEVLGELGLLGFMFVLLLLGAVAVTAVQRYIRAEGEERVTLAAIGGAAIAFAVAAGIDWMWEMTVVTIVGLALFALLVARTAAEPDRRPPHPPAALGVRLVAGLVAIAAIGVAAVPWLSDREVRESRAAALQGRTQDALETARTAERLAPWASSPDLQRALVLEGAGRVAAARGAIGDAIAGNRSDWRLWLVRARIERQAGDGAAATVSMRRAASLNPRSQLFAKVKP